jgi:uncharacterized protein (TIGR02266 family)
MKRLLFIAGDPALTRFATEALSGGDLDAGDPAAEALKVEWEVARAHSSLEGHLLVTRGGRPFDAILLDQDLPDENVLEFLAKVRTHEFATDVPIFILSERGRDPHIRRTASSQFSVMGYLEKPLTAASLRQSLQSLEGRRKVLLVESHAELAEELRKVLRSHHYVTEHAVDAGMALEKASRFQPHVIVASLNLPEMRGVQLCVEIRRTRNTSKVPIILYGDISDLDNIDENAHRADDFLASPFENEVLVERIQSLVGRGNSRSLPEEITQSDEAEASLPKELISTLELSRDVLVAKNRRQAASGPTPAPSVSKKTTELPQHTHTQGKAHPPRSASPAPVAPTQRSAKRVPCHISIAIENGDKLYESRTLDISHGGIFAASDIAIAVGTLVNLKFQIPRTNRVIQAMGKVAWLEAAKSGGTAGFGVKFSRINQDDLQLIVNYVNQVGRVVFSPH